VVKGTRFEVSSDAASGDAVRVLEGRVEVRNLRDGRAALVNAGQLGRVRSASSTGVEIEEQTIDSGGNGNTHGGGAGARGNGNGGGGEPWLAPSAPRAETPLRFGTERRERRSHSRIGLRITRSFIVEAPGARRESRE